jgi:hypothetical protein
MGSRLLLAIGLLFTVQAHAYFQQELMNGKVEKAVQRQENQWNIYDWLAQKKSIALMDKWLALHTSVNTFDLTLSGGLSRWRFKSSEAEDGSINTLNSQIHSAEMFITMFDFYAEYEMMENNRQHYGGALGVRVFGASSQDSSLVLRWGWRRYRDFNLDENWENQFAEATAQIYLFSFLGVDGSYRHYLPDTSAQHRRLEGSRGAVGGFIDFLFFRLYGRAFDEPIEIRDGATKIKEERYGAEGGLKLLF